MPKQTRVAKFEHLTLVLKLEWDNWRNDKPAIAIPYELLDAVENLFEEVG